MSDALKDAALSLAQEPVVTIADVIARARDRGLELSEADREELINDAMAPSARRWTRRSLATIPDERQTWLVGFERLALPRRVCMNCQWITFESLSVEQLLEYTEKRESRLEKTAEQFGKDKARDNKLQILYRKVVRAAERYCNGDKSMSIADALEARRKRLIKQRREAIRDRWIRKGGGK
jgi:hypothetical protein